ncbi:efflux RND transporter periplasmic adaptor subunit [Sulfurovum sp.]|uniref:efflux RND transporter periplasmic adaptor subunit n=1 Tax=Sulfurovum sp. TaxID=1969726 RepID=UPI002867FC7F|nr:efflux RND transporter periplasmic adaptor subunit [Sulfurovum sp.]
MSTSYKHVYTLTLFISLLFLSGCGEEKVTKAPKAPPPLKVQTVTVEKKNHPIWVQFTGTTKAVSDQEIRARVAGRLEKRFFEDGATVKKGDKLFLIEQSQYQSNLDAAISAKQQDQAALALSKADVRRYQPLVKEGLAARSTLEQYEAKRDALIASIAADDAAIRNAELELSYTLITAPISGQVSSRRVDVGNLVGYGESTLLTTIVQTEKIYTYFSPSESAAQMLYKYRSRKDLPAFIEVRGQGDDIFKRKRLDGIVDFANNIVDPLTSTVAMRATIDNKEQTVYPGTFVYINIFVTDEVSLIMVPPQAIFEDQLGKFVYTVDTNNTARRTSIKTALSSRYYTSITSGLKDHDRVVISGLVKVKNGRLLLPEDMTESKGIAAVMKEHKLIPDEVQK